MRLTANRRFAVRQAAIRRLLLDGNGNLTRDARVVVCYLRKLLGAGPTDHITKFTPQGTLDPVATSAAAQRREVWDQLVRLLNLDAYTLVNLEDEE